MPLTRLAFPEIWDSTMLEDLHDCPRKFFWEWIWRIRPAGTSVHLETGAAFARGLELARHAYFAEGRDEELAVRLGLLELLRVYPFEDGSPNKKPLNKVAEAFVGYFDRWPMSSDYLVPVDYYGRKGIEFSFAVPLPILHPVSGNPLTICGRADMIASYKDGVFIEDDKTQSQLGATWPAKWKMRGQFQCYTWAARQYGYQVDGAIVRGIRITENIDFAEAIVYEPVWKTNRWYSQTLDDIRRALVMWEDSAQAWQAGIGYEPYDSFPLAMNDACNSYGGCGFLDLCDQPNPLKWIDERYQDQGWNPLTRKDEPLV